MSRSDRVMMSTPAMTDRTSLARMQSAVDAATLQRHLEWFSRVPRDTGGEGEDRAAAYLAAELHAVGAPVTVHEFDAFLSYPRAPSLRTLGAHAREFRALTHSFVPSTPVEGVTAEVVRAADGRFDDARGKIALVHGLATPVTILQASRAGCAGLVFANEDRVIHNMIGTTIWGTPGLDEIDRMPSVPTVSVDVESGRALDAALAGGAPVHATVTTVVETGWYRSKLPELRIPGTREPERFVLVVTHDIPIRFLRNAMADDDPISGAVRSIDNASLLVVSRAQMLHGITVMRRRLPAGAT